MNLTALMPSPANSANWDSLSDLLWQWVMGEAGHEVTWLAFVIEHATLLLARDPEIVFQFAEICIQLEVTACETRAREVKPGLCVRIFLVE